MNPSLRVIPALLPLIAAAAWPRPVSGVEPFKVALRFVSDRDIKPETPSRLAVPFAIGPVKDARGLEDPTVLGETQAHGTRPVVAATPLPDFVEKALRASLAEWRVNVAPDAALTLRCEILQFSIMEQHRVVVDLKFRFLLENQRGEVVWKAEVAGDDGVWGSSLSEKNYNQAASTATKRALADLFDKTDFREGLKKQ
jgi:hypothetical protein